MLDLHVKMSFCLQYDIKNDIQNIYISHERYTYGSGRSGDNKTAEVSSNTLSLKRPLKGKNQNKKQGTGITFEE